jgi:hypothetical protein
MNFKQYLLKDIGFHTTNVENYEEIKQKGLKINQKSFYTKGSNDWLKRAYGIVPIFLSLSKTSYKEGVQLTINVKGLKKGADLGSLIDHGAIIDENGFYFEKKSNVQEKFKEEEYDYEELYDGNLVEEFIDLTKTFVIMEDIPANRIINVTWH